MYIRLIFIAFMHTNSCPSFIGCQKSKRCLCDRKLINLADTTAPFSPFVSHNILVQHENINQAYFIVWPERRIWCHDEEASLRDNQYSQRQASERLGMMKQLTCWLLLRYFLKSIHCGAVSFRPGPQKHLSHSYQLFCQNFHRVPYLPMNFYYWQINRILL